MSAVAVQPAATRARARQWGRTLAPTKPAQVATSGAPVPPSGPAFAALLPLHPPPAAGGDASTDAGDAPTAAALEGIPEAVLEQARSMGPLLPPSARRRHTFSLVCACNMNR